MSRGVLIVSASAGTGHVRAGEALRETIELRMPGTPVRHVDILDLAPGWVQAAYARGFELVAARAPWIWHGLYRLTDGPDADQAKWGGLAERILFHEFRRLIASEEWGLCLCTHFLPAQLAARRPGLPPFALVVTDFMVHRYWVQPGVRHYFVATEATADELRRRVPGAAAEVTGIPISQRFAAAPTREEARCRLGLRSDARVALIMGGGLGIGVEESVEAALAAETADLQVVAVCGRNDAARARLTGMGRAPERLRVFGHVGEMECFLAAADLVVTKPGGLSTAESLAVGRPLLLSRAIPGHEDANVRALAAAGAALYAPGPRALRDALERLLSEPDQLAALTAAATRLGRPDAADRIVRSATAGLRYSPAA